MKTIGLPALLALLLAGTSCTVVTNFGAFKFGVDLGSSDGATADSGSGEDLAVGDGSIVPTSCGGAGQPCCPTQPACFGGGCCSATMGNVCVASGTQLTTGFVCLSGQSAPCGLVGQPCCGNNTCHDVGCCVGGLCQSGTSGTCGADGACMNASCAGTTAQGCGGSDQACCPGSPSRTTRAADFCVASGLACEATSGKCQPCGGSGDICCAGGVCDAGGCCDASQNKCVPNGSGCSNGQGTCSNGGCQSGACGKLNQACCGGSVLCTDQFTTCSNGTCIACGGSAEPCCPGKGGGVCVEPYVCDNGTVCRRCGEAGQRCCAGDTCAKLACVNGSC